MVVLQGKASNLESSINDDSDDSVLESSTAIATEIQYSSRLHLCHSLLRLPPQTPIRLLELLFWFLVHQGPVDVRLLQYHLLRNYYLVQHIYFFSLMSAMMYPGKAGLVGATKTEYGL